MNKDEKTAVVEELTGRLKSAEAIFAIDYRGISVPQAAELRSGLRDAGASFRVVKNRLTLRAADAAGTEAIKDFLTGPTALTLVDGDVALAAKTLSRLGGEWELLEFKGGIMDGAALDPDSFQAIAKLPGRDQLNAQLAGIVASPLTGLVRGLGSMVQGLASQLQQIADQGLVTGEAPAAEPDVAPPEEAPAAKAEGDGDKGANTSEGTPGTPGSEAEEVPGDETEESAADEASDSADVEASPPDPDPEASPEESPSEEEAPEGESAGLDEEAGGTGEGDQDLGEDTPAEDTPADDAGDDTTSEDSDESKEN